MSSLMKSTCGFVLVLIAGTGSGGCCIDADLDSVNECGSRTVVAPEEPANQAPRPSGAISPQTIGIGQSVNLNVSSYFQDPDGDALSYGARSNATQVASASVSGSSLTITGEAAGVTAVTVTARDPGGLAATQSVAVTVLPVR